MKKATVYILVVVMLLGCFAGCRRSDLMEDLTTPGPTATAKPATTTKPAPTPNTNNNNGLVNDGNGIIEDNDGNSATPDKGDNGILDGDIPNNDLMNDDPLTGAAGTPNPSAATDSNTGSRARAR